MTNIESRQMEVLFAKLEANQLNMIENFKQFAINSKKTHETFYKKHEELSRIVTELSTMQRTAKDNKSRMLAYIAIVASMATGLSKLVSKYLH